VSFLNSIRRSALAELSRTRLKGYVRVEAPVTPNEVPYSASRVDYRANVLNAHARAFYCKHGAEVVEPAFETLPDSTGREVMIMRYCLRYELDACLKTGNAHHLKEPLSITNGDHRYRLHFDCDACRMSIILLE